ncbi:cardiolipin synthase [Comamonas sp. JNW]|uniref:cardiolipin synthase n=1 Tax=Comamonas sp. JNW TaxID=2170731 RepID=UPI000DE7B5B9|nr:cardiolipin synthase [Comamonas sp. JNW]PWB20867.1 cardiolipin synthase [Comamonas sp. JNW]
MASLSPYLTKENIVAVLSVIWPIYLGVVGIWILMQRRAPVATLGWLLSMGSLPVVGLIVYYFIGPQRMKRQRIKRLRARNKNHVRETTRRIRDGQPEAPAQLREMVKLVEATCGFPITSAESVELLSGGAATFDRILEDVAQARHHVHLEYYIFEPDQTGTRLRDALVERAKAGVKVRMLVDALGSKRVNRKFIAPLLAAGGEFAVFHPTRIGRRLRPVINFRSHRKILVVDGQIGFTGGVNITDEEDRRVNTNAYHDVHLRMAGPIVTWLQTTFLEDWAYALEKSPQDMPANLDLLLPDMPDGRHAMQLVSSGPDNPTEPIHRAHVAAIQSATVRVWLTTPYFVPTEPAMYALTSAALRGVDVRLLVPEKSDSIFVTAAARSYYEELISAGAKVYEYSARMLHSKTLVVDDNLTIIGTANFDNRSFRLNYEVCAIGYGPELNARLQDQFNTDLMRSKQVASRRKQRFLPRLGDSIARLFSPLL